MNSNQNAHSSYFIGRLEDKMISFMFWLIFIQVGIFCVVSFLLATTFIAERKAEKIFERAKAEKNDYFIPFFEDGRNK